MGVRTTIRVDNRLMERVRRIVPRRGFNQFVNEALATHVEVIERMRQGRLLLEREMIEGHLATRADREEMNRAWEVVDGEGWPA
jgi:hypothetical protein